MKDNFMFLLFDERKMEEWEIQIRWNGGCWICNIGYI